jgi:hypothetical protein
VPKSGGKFADVTCEDFPLNIRASFGLMMGE